MNTVDWGTLIPELKTWNNGEGVDPETWVGCEGNFRLAAAYSLVFWPNFVEMDGMVFRGGMDRTTLDSWLAGCSGNNRSVEATANHLHLVDIHYVGCPDASVERIIYLGNLLKQIYAVKLAAEFPGRAFVVDFFEPPDQKLSDYQITFYQGHDS
ncbi:MAG: hypothetical protein ABIZ09_01465 [Rhodoferax sp.]